MIIIIDLQGATFLELIYLCHICIMRLFMIFNSSHVCMLLMFPFNSSTSTAAHLFIVLSIIPNLPY